MICSLKNRMELEIDVALVTPSVSANNFELWNKILKKKLTVLGKTILIWLLENSVEKLVSDNF